jgi:hypothetical protein
MRPYNDDLDPGHKIVAVLALLAAIGVGEKYGFWVGLASFFAVFLAGIVVLAALVFAMVWTTERLFSKRRVTSVSSKISAVLRAEPSDALRMISNFWVTMEENEFKDFLDLMNRQFEDSAHGAEIRERFLDARKTATDLIHIEAEYSPSIRPEIAYYARYEPRKLEDISGILYAVSHSSDHSKKALVAARLVHHIDEITQWYRIQRSQFGTP